MKLVDQRSRAIVSADREAHGAVRVHVVRAGLGVIFDDEDGCVFPIGARRNRFDEAAHGVIVVRDHELRRGKIIFHSRRVIVGKPHNSERRHGIAAARFAFGNETAKFGEPFAKARIAAAIQIGVVLSYGGIGSG